MRKPRRKSRNRRFPAERRRTDIAIMARAQSRVRLRFPSSNDYFDLMSFAERCILADAAAGYTWGTLEPRSDSSVCNSDIRKAIRNAPKKISP